MKIFKLNISILICFLGFNLICFGQTNSASDTAIIKRTISIFNVVKVEGSTPLTTRDLKLDPKLIEKLELPSKAEFRKNYRYGDVKADFIMVFTPKKGVRFLNLTDILDRYRVDQRYRNYSVLINRTETEDPKNLLINDGAIDTVIVNKERGYINIITSSYDNYMKFRDEVKKDKQRRLDEMKARGK